MQCMSRSIDIPAKVARTSEAVQAKNKEPQTRRWAMGKVLLQQVTDSSWPRRLPLSCTLSISLQRSSQTMKAKGEETFEMQMKDNTLLEEARRSLCGAALRAPESQRDLQRLVYRLQKFCLSRSFSPAREDWGCTKVGCCWILNRGSLRCRWLCWTWHVAFYTKKILYLPTRFPEFARAAGLDRISPVHLQNLSSALFSGWIRLKALSIFFFL